MVNTNLVCWVHESDSSPTLPVMQHLDYDLDQFLYLFEARERQEECKLDENPDGESARVRKLRRDALNAPAGVLDERGEWSSPPELYQNKDVEEKMVVALKQLVVEAKL